MPDPIREPATEKRPTSPTRLLFLRVSPEDIILYANRALASYAGVAKRDLLGAPLDVFHTCLKGEIAGCFTRPDRGRTSNRLVTDAEGRVFEARIYSEGGILDILLEEVSARDDAFSDLFAATGIPADSLTEDELRVLRHPEQRFATVTATTLHNLGPLADRTAPQEAQLMLEAFIEECSEAILETAGSVGEVSAHSILGIYGSPRYHRDHSLRGVLSACLQMEKLASLRDAFAKQGREMPPAAIGIASGDLLLGTIGLHGGRSCFTAAGSTADIAERLTRLARPGEALLTDETLRSLLAGLPDNWEYIQATTEDDPDLSDFQWNAEEVDPLPDHLRKVVYLIGPGVKDDPSLVELYLDYLYTVKIPGTAAIPVLRVVRPQIAGSSIDLDEGYVVTSAAAPMLGRYRLLSILGQGGMGKVWKAQDRFGNPVAVKVINGDSAPEAYLQRFKREAEIMARLPHRNICHVYEFNEFEGVSYLVMEFVDGLTLSDLLYGGDPGQPASHPLPPTLPDLIRSIRSHSAAPSDEPPPAAVPRATTNRILPFEQTLALIGKICDAVQFAHEHGVLHRDLKPGNILIREDGEPLVADFGLAKIGSIEDGRSLSISGHVVGTMENMAPEQARSSKNVDERADVFAIGTILYQMLTGQRFFETTGDLIADAQKLQTHEAPRPRSLNRHIDPDLEIITLKALRTDPNERYRTAAALRADLDHYRRGEPISARPVTAGELIKKLVQRHRSVAAVIAISVLIFVAGSLLALWIINERRLDAIAARDSAKEAQRAAEAAKSLAEQRQDAAEKALADAKLAREGEEAARGLHAQVVEESRQILEERDRAQREREKISLLVDERTRALDEARKSLDQLKTKSTPDVLPSPAPPPALAEALNIFMFQLAPMAVDRLLTAEEVHSIVNKAMDQVCNALIEEPAAVPGWMLKARLHLSVAELQPADDALATASRIVAGHPQGPAAAEIAELRGNLEPFTSSGIRPVELADRLESGSNPQNLRVAAVLRFLAKRSSRSIARPLASGEIALSLRASNPEAASVRLTPASDGTFSVEISGASRLPNLSALKTLSVKSLAIHDAQEIDWPVVFILPLESLDLSRCQIERLPLSPSNRGLSRVRRLNLSSTGLASLHELQSLPLLEDLDISYTRITDLGPLAGRRLKALNIAGLAASTAVLEWMPLERLTIDAHLASRLSKDNRLRQHRTLRILRIPEDPESQTAGEFWRRLDTGAYKAPTAGNPPRE